MLELPLERTASAAAGAAYGAALLGGVAGGVFTDPRRGAAAVRVTGEVDARPRAGGGLRAPQRERYQALYPALPRSSPADGELDD